MQIKSGHYIGFGLCIAIIAISYAFFRQAEFFFLLVGLGVLAAVLPFVLGFVNDTRIAGEKEDMFLEFTRNLVESVKTGTPISKSIVNVRDKNYGHLSPHVSKLANQITLGIPLGTALQVFSRDAKNKTISRALTLIGQAEKAGGDIGEILESVAEAVNVSDRLKKERRAAISTLVVQGYIIFFVFIIIILVMQFNILPLVSGIAVVGEATGGSFGNIGTGGEQVTQTELANSFLALMLVQGFFTGLTIGKLSEGSSKAGIKHSFTLMFFSFLFSAGASLIFGG